MRKVPTACCVWQESIQHPWCYTSCHCCHGCCYGSTLLPCALVAGLPTQASQLKKWSLPGWYTKAIRAIKNKDDAALRRIVAGPSWNPGNANQKFELNQHDQIGVKPGSACLFAMLKVLGSLHLHGWPLNSYVHRMLGGAAAPAPP